MELLLDAFVEKKIIEMGLKERITSYLVKKKQRGTYQALEEGTEIEKQVIENLKIYIKQWLLEEFIDGSLKDKINKEINSSAHLEIARHGFGEIYKK